MASKADEKLDEKSNSSASSAVTPVYPYSLPWSVPRIAIPSVLGPLSLAPFEWWFYVGYVKDASNQWYNIFSLICKKEETIFGMDINFGMQYLSIAECKENGKFYRTPIGSNGLPSDYGIFWGEIGDKTFNITLDGFGSKTTYKYIGQNEMYPSTICVGMIGIQYNFSCSTKCVSIDAGNQTDTVECGINLNVEDKRGTVLEVMNGVIGDTYEVNQPKLAIMDAKGNDALKSYITFEGKKIEIVEGNIILDRQAIMSNLKEAAPKTPAKASEKKTDSEEKTEMTIEEKKQLLEKYGKEAAKEVEKMLQSIKHIGHGIGALSSIFHKGTVSKSSASGADTAVTSTSSAPSAAASGGSNAAQSNSFYTGHYGILNLDDGTTFIFAQVWVPGSVTSMPQWQACTATGEAPNAFSYAAKYLPFGQSSNGNSGAFLKGNTTIEEAKKDVKIDWDINILIPNEKLRDQSPHYKSPSGYVYGTAWTVSINGHCNYPLLYLYADNPKCESWDGVWEGSITIFKSLERTEQNCVGRGWFEQMGQTKA